LRCHCVQSCCVVWSDLVAQDDPTGLHNAAAVSKVLMLKVRE
jgi:hypothetical protein